MNRDHIEPDPGGMVHGKLSRDRRRQRDAGTHENSKDRRFRSFRCAETWRRRFHGQAVAHRLSLPDLSHCRRGPGRLDIRQQRAAAAVSAGVGVCAASVRLPPSASTRSAAGGKLGMDTSWRHAFEIRNSPALPSIAAVGVLLFAIFIAWLLTAQAFYQNLFGPHPPTSVSAFISEIFATGTRLDADHPWPRHRLRLCRGRAVHHRRRLSAAARSRCRRL